MDKYKMNIDKQYILQIEYTSGRKKNDIDKMEKKKNECIYIYCLAEVINYKGKFIIPVKCHFSSLKLNHVRYKP